MSGDPGRKPDAVVGMLAVLGFGAGLALVGIQVLALLYG